SSTHLLLYQEVAEKAIASCIPLHPPYPHTEKLTGKQMSTRGPNFRQTLGRSCYVKDDALIVYSKSPRYGLCAMSPVPSDGRYRVQMSIAAVGAAQKAVPVALSVLEGGGPEGPVLREMRDIQPGKPGVVEFEVELNRRQSFVVNLLLHWDIRATKK